MTCIVNILWFQNSSNNNDKKKDSDIDEQTSQNTSYEGRSTEEIENSDAPSALESPRQDSGYTPTWEDKDNSTQNDTLTLNSTRQNGDKITDDIYYQFLSEDQKRALEELQDVPGGLDLKPDDHLFQYLTEDQKNALMEIENLKIDLEYTGE